MSTGAELASITSKKVLAFEDFGDRMLGYLRTLAESSIEKQFPSDGTYGDTKITLTDDGANRVHVGDGQTLAGTDGAGHVIELGDTLVPLTGEFSNLYSVLYEVGMQQCDEPLDVIINPRTGLPEYTHFREEIGESGDPDNVTDVGLNLRFDINGICGTDNCSGRTVRVFKKIPGASASVKATAIQELTVAFSGGINRVDTTDGAFMGQPSAHSLVAADYTVQLVGISIRSGTAISTGKYHFIGTVAGNAGTPVVFDITGQTLLDPTDASDITFTDHTGPAPISWNVPVGTVQSAIEAMVDTLSSTTIPGASKLGIDDATFTQIAPHVSADWGGLGTPYNDAQAVFNAIDAAFIKRSASVTVGTTISADRANLHDLAVGTTGSRAYELKGAAAITYDHGVAGLMPSGNHPWVRGEGMERSTVLFDTAAVLFNIEGAWSDLAIGNTGSTGSFQYNTASKFDRCKLQENAFHFQSGNDTTDVGVVRDCVFESVTGSTATALADNVTVENAAGGPLAFINCLFLSGSQGDVLRVFGTASTAVVFINCKFTQTRDADACLDSSASYVHFIDCTFKKTATAGIAPAITISTGPGVVFDRCYFESANGSVLFVGPSATSNKVAFNDCQFVSSGSATADDSTFVNASSSVFRNCRFNHNDNSMRSGLASLHPLVRLGPKSSAHSCVFDGFTTRLSDFTGHVFDGCEHLEDLKFIFSSEEIDAAVAGWTAANLASPALIEIRGNAVHTQVRGITVEGTIDLSNGTDDKQEYYGLILEDCTIDGLLLGYDYTVGTGPGGWLGSVFIGKNATVNNVVVKNGGDAYQEPGLLPHGLFVMEGDDAHLRNVSLPSGYDHHANSDPAGIIIARIGRRMIAAGIHHTGSPLLGANVAFIWDLNAAHHMVVEGSIIGLDGSTASDLAFVSNQTAAAEFVDIRGNTFYVTTGALNKAANSWIEMKVGSDYVHTHGNMFLNAQSTVPTVAVEILAPTAVENDNIEAGSVAGLV